MLKPTRTLVGTLTLVAGLMVALPARATSIHDIQGAGHISPLNGMAVSGVAGIVTAMRSNGFYMQEPNPDSDAATSEGIFVFTGAAPSVAVGDSVSVGGTVTEFRPGGSASTNLTTTEITSPTITVVSSGNPLPAPTVIGTGGRLPPTAVIEDDATGDVETSGVFDPATDGIDFYESFEGMLVQINNAVVVGPTTVFGEIAVLGDDGANAGLRSGRGGIVVGAADFNPERIILADTLVPLPQANVGDHFAEPIVGVLDYSFGNFKVLVTLPPTIVPGNLARQSSTGPASYQLAIATFNLQNLDPGDGARFDRLAGLIVNNLQAPDLLALQGVQDNNGPTDDGIVDASTTFNTLIAAIQGAGGPTYEFRQISPVNNQDGGEPGGNIRVGFLFRTDRGLSFIDRPGGDATTATTVVTGPSGPQLSMSPGRIDPTNPAFTDSRKPLAGEFGFKGDKLFVIANHFNSKGGDQLLFGHFQPPSQPSEAQRVEQAEVVRSFVDAILASDPGANIVVLGDLNDFEFSGALAALKGDALNNLTETLPESERYTFLFEGNSEALDHILVSDTLFDGPREYAVVHVNAEFADQASDHDPAVAFLCVDRTPPSLSVQASPSTLWPPNHKYVTATAAVGVSDNADPNPLVTLVTVTSNEPDNGLGDGDHPDDIVILDDHTFRLRAERSGKGIGRVYTITYQATDACGNTTTASTTVRVPHGQGDSS